MKNKEYMSLKKMIEYINKALKYTEGCSFETFSRNEEKVDATVFAISQIGELVKNITKETMERYNNIEWIIIKNLRNKVVHDYEGINLNLIWDIITDDIIQLKMDLEKILKEA
ncbi:MAG: HepT-like ribonuclease domain-containing protein [Clostridia bacterium]|nr:HepT-like ribonuclease domain-containing protein [Clostridia bacterium]